MHIVVLTMYYAPDLTGIASTATCLCEYLATAGHRVSVLTGPPHYPQWKVPEAYKGKWWLRETIKGVEVHRGYVFLPSRRTTIRRILYDTSVAVSSIFTGLAVKDADVILAITPPLQLGLTGLFLSRLSKAPLVLKVQDLVPDLAIAVGMLRNRFAIGLAHRMERYVYQKSAAILLLSQGFMGNVKSKGIAESKLVLHPLCVDTESIRPMARDGQWRKRFNLTEEQFVILHAGNMGAKQKLENVLDAAVKLRQEKNLVFVFVGDGTEKPRLEAYARERGLSSVRFLALQPREGLPDMLSCADVLLLNQSATIVDMVMPSKLLSYMAAGRPVVAAANAHSDAADCIRRAECGLVVPPDDPEALAGAIRSIYRDSQFADRLGRMGRLYAEENFAQDRNLKFFEGVLNTLAAGGEPPLSMSAATSGT